MELWLCEHPYDTHGACGVFTSLAAATEHMKKCGCVVYVMEQDGETYAVSDEVSRKAWCENCGKSGFTDEVAFIGQSCSEFCSAQCKEETEAFYEAGLAGVVGSTTRDMKRKILDCAELGEHPYQGCAGIDYTEEQRKRRDKRDRATPQELAAIVRALEPTIQ